MVKMTKKQKVDLIKFGMIAKGNNIKLMMRSSKKKDKKKNKFPPQDTSTDIVCGDPTEDYRY